MTIEIVHTDAEGRMVLADTLTLASRKKPKAIIDFATLTGCMHVAMGDRYSGAISNRSRIIMYGNWGRCGKLERELLDFPMMRIMKKILKVKLQI